MRISRRKRVLGAGALISAMLCMGSVSVLAQPFNVLQFRPWAGYAIPNGLWLTGDFNGDGKKDIVHAVQGADYVHVWTSNGAGGFSVGTFSPWSGYAIPNGLWLTGDFNGDGKTDILHAVSNTDYVHLWTSTGNGRFNVTSFSPWSGYAIPNGIWLTGDFNRDGRTDIFHAVANTDYAHIWLSNGNGGFTITTFRPWPGYAIPNGEWRTGDFDGDGRTDIFHAVAGGDYAHIWTSTGAGGNFTVGTFRPWAGYAIPNGEWMTGDFDGDGRADVLHAVANTDYVHIWRSTGTAQFNVSTFSPWAGYAIPNGLWLPADITGDGKTDIVHAVQGTDYVHPWISTMPGTNPANAQVVIEGIEITQAIQDMPHSVALVANRQTVARVYLGVNAPAPITVRGTLTVRSAATGLTATVNSTGNASVNPAQNGQLRAKREALGSSLNFTIPAGFTAIGARQFTLTGVTNVASGSAIACGNCATTTRAASFINASSLRLRIIGLQYTTGTPPNAVNRAPTNVDFALLRSWLLRAYPVDQIISTQTIVNSTNAWQFDCNSANAQLASIRANDMAGGGDARTHYFGLVSNGGGYMRGCASGIPAAADPTVVVSGPTGNPAGGGLVPANANGDNDASFGDWYGGHELGHTFGRPHPGFCNGNSADDPSFPYPNGQISTNDGAMTGFDVGDAGNAIAASVLPGASRFDIMTYCNQPQWLSAYTYQAIRSRLNVEDNAFPSSGGPDGGGPNAGAPARAVAARSAADPTSAKSDPNCPCEAPVAPSLKAPPKVVVGSQAPSHITVLYADRPPIPPASAKPPRIPEARQPPSIPAPMMAAAAVASRENAPQTEPEQPPREPPPQVALKQGRFVSIVARVNLTKNTGKIVYANQVGRALVPTVPPTDRAVIRVLDGSGKVLTTHNVWVREDTDVPPEEDKTAVIDAIIPYDSEAKRVELLLSGKLIDTIRVQPKAPRIGKGRLFGVADEKSMRPMANYKDAGALVLEWETADSAGDELTYIVQSSSDNGKTWLSLAVGLREPKFIIARDRIDWDSSPLFRVIASDGWHSSAPVQLKVSPPAQK